MNDLRVLRTGMGLYERGISSTRLNIDSPKERGGHAVAVGLHDDGRLAGARRRHQERRAGGAARRYRHVEAAVQLDF